jgi:formate dehydrogenase major subunit/formate dehydrogenase alpha subunit
MTNSMQEADKANVILITGTNTTWNHPVFGGMIKKAVMQKGVKLIVVDPRDIGLAKYADIHLRQNPGSDNAWLMGLQHIIVKNNWHNKQFIEERTEGWEEYARSLEFYTPEKVEEISGIPKEQLYEAAKLYATSGRGAAFYAMGITQHSHGVDNVMAISNLQMILGNFGLEGTGVNPLRGQNNVQGACDMGGLPNVFTGYQPVINEDARKKFADAWGRKLEEMDDKVGQTVTSMVRNAGGSIKAIYIVGENPMISDPNLHHAEKQLKKLDFLWFRIYSLPKRPRWLMSYCRLSLLQRNIELSQIPRGGYSFPTKHLRVPQVQGATIRLLLALLSAWAVPIFLKQQIPFMMR